MGELVLGKTKFVILVVATCAFLTGTWGSCNISWGKEGLLASPFTLPSLQGQSMSLADQKGDIILINFWATWCTDCVQEMPEFEKLYQKYHGKGLSIFAISIDQKGQPAVEAFLKKENLKLTYPILLDPDGHVARAYQLRWLPVTIVVGRDGRIIETVLGARPWGSKEIMKSFDYLLNESH